MKSLKTIFFWAFSFGLLATLSGSARAEQAAPQQGSKKLLPRAYKGAPPLIPHDVERRKAACLDCHRTGFVKAPIVRHPERNYQCLQCHVGQDLAVQAFPAASSQAGKRSE